jgi:hypothetical protein
MVGRGQLLAVLVALAADRALALVVGTALGEPERLVVLVASIALAALTKRLIEEPLRGARYLTAGHPRRHLSIAAATLVLIAGCLTGVSSAAAIASAAVGVAENARQDCFAAASMVRDSGCEEIHELDSMDVAVAASADMANTVTHGQVCVQDRDAADVLVCEFGADERDASLTVALVGDSHAAHWIGALDIVAGREGWRAVEYLKSSCPGVLGDGVQADWYPSGAANCRAWTASVVAEVAARSDIDAVITSSISRNYVTADPVGSIQGPVSAKEYRDTWATWIAAGKQVLVVADTPAWGVGDVPTRVSGAGTSDPCSVDVSVRANDPMAAAAENEYDPSLSLVDMNDFFCDEDRCHVAIGGVVAIGDGNHMTTTVSRSLAPFLGERLSDVLRDE